MRIFILPVSRDLQPSKQPFRYPRHNHDYGVEQDFLNFLEKSTNLLVDSPERADFHYLPIFWTRWHLNHDYGKTGIPELKAKTLQSVLNFDKTFTICQYDDGPLVNLKNAKIFYASRKNISNFDVPLLSKPHNRPFFPVKKQYLATFAGRIDTHPLRKRLYAALKTDNRINFSDGDKGTGFFIKNMLASYICLCPRGYGGSSFRFYEAMQLGIVPFLIGDIDTRPFKKFIDWKSCSLYSPNASGATRILNMYSLQQLLVMGENAKQIYNNQLQYGKWCEYVLLELER